MFHLLFAHNLLASGSLNSQHLNTLEIREAAELDLEEAELRDGEGGSDGRQHEDASGEVGFAFQVEEDDAVEALEEELDHVLVDAVGLVQLLPEAEVEAGEDVAADGQHQEGASVGQVVLVESSA